MFTTGVIRAFTARHALSGNFGPESVEPTHRYRVELVCRTETLDENGFSFDIALLEKILAEELTAIDDRFLNALEFFRDRQPSLENLAVYLSGRIVSRLSETDDRVRITRLEVKLWESDTAWAAYETAP